MKMMDLHCDTISYLYGQQGSLKLNNGQFDLMRAKEAGLAVQFFALFTQPADPNTTLRMVIKQIDYFHEELSQNQDQIFLIEGYADILNKENVGKLGALLHLEGAECLGTDMEVLRTLYRLGVRSLGLTWNHRNLLADGVGEGPGAGGLSKMGRKVIKSMERLGMLLDLSHIAPAGFYGALETYSLPVFVTHANARNLCDHPRNLDDQQLQSLAEHGGVIGITQVNDFVKPSQANLEDVLDHIAYIADLIGVEHIALGSDFDGADHMVLAHIGKYKDLAPCLRHRGFSDQEIQRILYKNGLGVIKSVLKA